MGEVSEEHAPTRKKLSGDVGGGGRHPNVQEGPVACPEAVWDAATEKPQKALIRYRCGEESG